MGPSKKQSKVEQRSRSASQKGANSENAKVLQKAKVEATKSSGKTDEKCKPKKPPDEKGKVSKKANSSPKKVGKSPSDTGKNSSQENKDTAKTNQKRSLSQSDHASDKKEMSKHKGKTAKKDTS